MVNSYLATNDIAPQILFYDGPASNSYNSARHNFYGWGYTPTFQIDGVHQQIGWNQSIVQGYIDDRLVVPSYVQIEPSFEGNAYGGTAYYSITAEEDLGVSSEIKVWSAIVESHDIASSEYGVYEGQELMREPRAWPLGASGTPISFTGPYPQTVEVEGSYTLDPAEHTFDNLDVVTYVQVSSGDKEVLNADFMDLPDTSTGTYETETAVESEASLLVGPNPCSGVLSVSSVLPPGTTGKVEIYDICGRLVEKLVAGTDEQIRLNDAGVYFACLTTSSGQVINERLTVID
jgi:hypothetical protein